ncbi:endolytic transglycosylase MltG [Streptomyces sp. NPDC054841]
MTEYGRGPGSEPWHPEDPLYGDQGWRGQQAEPGPASYGGQPQQQYPQQPQAQSYYGSGNDPQYSTGYQQQYSPQQYSPQQYDGQQYPPQQYPPQQYGETWDTGQQRVWDTGQQPVWDTGQQPAMPYDPNTGAAPYGGADYYGTPEAYPPPQPPGRRTAPAAEPHRAPEPEPDWQTDPQQEEDHPFFTGDDGHDDGGDDDPAGGGRRGGRDGRGPAKKKKKGRNGFACLFVAVVLVGGAGGAGYVGYQFWQGQFGAAPDYEGAGTGTVEVEIPLGASGTEIGNALKKAGVVKSVDAFVSAQNKNPKGTSIQPGVYILKKEMSGANAVKAMLDPSSRNAMSIPEGQRNVQIYARIDKRLDLAPGTTKKVALAQAKNLGLPDWAQGHPNLKDPLEGFLFPATYPVAKGSKPEDILAKMVARAKAEYTKAGVETKANQLGLEGPWELITVASLVQAEGKTQDDYRKMAEVVYNRLKPTNTETNQLLQFDSTFNYLKGRSDIKIGEAEINSNKDPYNTYTRKGLTPGPIGNPGLQALQGTLSPTKDGWMYFVATDGKHKTEFAKTIAEFQKLKDKFNEQSGNG